MVWGSIALDASDEPHRTTRMPDPQIDPEFLDPDRKLRVGFGAAQTAARVSLARVSASPMRGRSSPMSGP